MDKVLAPSAHHMEKQEAWVFCRLGETTLACTPPGSLVWKKHENVSIERLRLPEIDLALVSTYQCACI